MKSFAAAALRAGELDFRLGVRERADLRGGMVSRRLFLAFCAPKLEGSVRCCCCCCPRVCTVVRELDRVVVRSASFCR
jgi:hypothetical protein